ncbi:MAG: thermonuclease family protein [Actinomycetia bacterium]|nr:thermonuclease family protein [Actinomycetes bacterium]
MDAVGPAELVEVAVVFDGDTIELADGRRVRLVQIDTPEGGEHEECYAEEARAALLGWVSRGTEARLVADPLLDQEDRYGRLLRYVTIGGANINLELGRAGAATAWFVGGKRGAIADELLRAVRDARTERRGLWGACPGTPLEPLSGGSDGPG